MDENFLRGETLRVGGILVKTDLTGFLLQAGLGDQMSRVEGFSLN